MTLFAGLFYNASPASGDLNPNHQPFGFHPRALPNFPPGCPLVLETTLSQAGGQLGRSRLMCRSPNATLLPDSLPMQASVTYTRQARLTSCIVAPGSPALLLPACPPTPACAQDGAARVVRYLRDGAFLDAARSASLDARMLTYNAALDVLGWVPACPPAALPMTKRVVGWLAST